MKKAVNLLFIALMATAVNKSAAQEHCDTQLWPIHTAYLRIDEQYNTTGEAHSDSLRMVVSMAEKARQCYGSSHNPKRTWLLLRETWSLDKLEEYDRVASRLDLFERELASEAEDFYKADFYVLYTRLMMLKGDTEAALVYHAKVLPVLYTLSKVDQYQHRVTEAALQFNQGHYLAAALVGSKILKEALDADEEGDLAFPIARARYSIASARMLQAEELPGSDDWEQVAIAMKEAVDGFEKADKQDWVGISLANLAEIYHYLGNEIASDEYLERASSIAATIDDPVLKAHVTFEKGHIMVKRGQIAQAEAVLREGIEEALANDMMGSAFKLRVELAELLQSQGKLRLAQEQLQGVLKAKQAAFSEDMLEVKAAKVKAEELHLVVIQTMEQSARRLGLLLLALVVGLVGSGWVVVRRRQVSRNPAPAVVAPADLVFSVNCTNPEVFTAPECSVDREDPVFSERSVVPEASVYRPITRPGGSTGERRLYYLRLLVLEPDRVCQALGEKYAEQVGRGFSNRWEMAELIIEIERVVEGNITTSQAVIMSLKRSVGDQWPLTTTEDWIRFFA